MKISLRPYRKPRIAWKVLFGHAALHPDEVYSLGPAFRIGGDNHDRFYSYVFFDFIEDLEKFLDEDGVKPVFSVNHLNNSNGIIPFPLYDSHTGTSLDNLINLCGVI